MLKKTKPRLSVVLGQNHDLSQLSNQPNALVNWTALSHQRHFHF